MRQDCDRGINCQPSSVVLRWSEVRLNADGSDRVFQATVLTTNQAAELMEFYRAASYGSRGETYVALNV